MPAAEWFEFSIFSPSAGIRFPAIKHRYAITSSASDSTFSENFIPSVFAVLRLITNSNLVD